MKVVIVIVLFDTRLMWILSSVLMSRQRRQHYTKSHQYGSKTAMLFFNIHPLRHNSRPADNLEDSGSEVKLSSIFKITVKQKSQLLPDFFSWKILPDKKNVSRKEAPSASTLPYPHDLLNTVKSEATSQIYCPEARVLPKIGKFSTPGQAAHGFGPNKPIPATPFPQTRDDSAHDRTSLITG